MTTNELPPADKPPRTNASVDEPEVSAPRADAPLEEFMERFDRGMIEGFRRRFGTVAEPQDAPAPSGLAAGAEIDAIAPELDPAMCDTRSRNVGPHPSVDPDRGWVAWAPGEDEDAAILSAIECAPGTVICDTDDFLWRLGERIQRMVDIVDDPETTAADIQRWLLCDGLFPYEGGVPPGDVGVRLVAENAAVRERLSAWGALPDGRNMRVREMVAARAALDGEHDDPISGLESWFSRITRLP